jgi:hypothetical protein
MGPGTGDVVVRRIRPEDWAVARSLRLRVLADAPDAFARTYQVRRRRLCRASKRGTAPLTAQPPRFRTQGLALLEFVSRWAFEMTDPHVELAWLHVEGIGRQRFVAFDESSCQFIS